MRRLLDLASGRNPQIWEVVAASLVALAVAGWTATRLPEDLLRGGILLFASVDIGGGLVSNLTTATRKAWKDVSPAYVKAFYIFHLAVYPMLLWWLAGDDLLLLAGLMILLLAKVAAFAAGRLA